MNLSIVRVLVLLAPVFCAFPAMADDAAPVLSGDSLKPKSDVKLQVTSSSFKAGGKLAEEFTRSGKNISPPLSWSKGPKETQSYVVLVQDVSANKPEPALHWIVYDIPASVTSLQKDISPDAKPAKPEGALQGMNVRNATGWAGPKPPMGVAHSYHFQVFALDAKLGLDPAAANGAAVLAALSGHVLASGEIAATYETSEPAYDRHDLTGVWLSDNLRSGFKVADVSLTPEYAEYLKANKAATLGHPSPHGYDTLSCQPVGLVALVTGGILPIEIFNGDGEIFINKEAVNAYYRINLKRGHKPLDEITQNIFGESVGHWEGDTLVVDSLGLGGGKTLEGSIPHSDALHMVQRLKRVHYDTIENHITIDDAKAFTAPASVLVTYKARKDMELTEMSCTNERDGLNDKGEPTFKPAAVQ